jgi:hypothetical protein
MSSEMRNAIALAYRHGWSAGHQAAGRGEIDMLGETIAVYEGKPRASQPTPTHGPSRYQEGFQDGYRDGVCVRTASVRAPPPTPPQATMPAPQFLTAEELERIFDDLFD